MCGRYTLRASLEDIKIYFDIQQHFAMFPRYNIAPSLPVLVQKTIGTVDFLTWGLKPSWMNDHPLMSTSSSKFLATGGFLNARCDTVLIKPAFKESFKKRRCLIIADGYYEWKTMGRYKQPFYICREDKGLLAFGGIWEGDTCAILTTDANTALQPIHQRMPLILPKAHHTFWLSNMSDPIKDLSPLLVPYTNEKLKYYPVSPQVNNPRFDNASCILPLQ